MYNGKALGYTHSKASLWKHKLIILELKALLQDPKLLEGLVESRALIEGYRNC